MGLSILVWDCLDCCEDEGERTLGEGLVGNSIGGRGKEGSLLGLETRGSCAGTARALESNSGGGKGLGVA